MKISVVLYAFILTGLCFLQTGCSSSENDIPETSVYELRNIGTLATTEYTVGKIIQLNDNKEWYKFGDRKILISCKAKVKAGIDLNQLKDGAVQEAGDELTVKLPPVKLLSVEMDPNSIHTAMTSVNGFRSGFTQTDKNKILKMGEQSIRKQLDKTALLSDAKKNARIFVEDFYHQLGYNEVHVEFETWKANE